MSKSSGNNEKSEAEKNQENKDKKAIQDKITAKRAEVSKYNGLVGWFQRTKNHLSELKGSLVWNYNICTSSQLLTEVEITGIFEGVCAEKTKLKINNATRLIGLNILKTQDVMDGIDNQIAKLNTQISTLNTEITNLSIALAKIGAK